jgi:hypothetical protein
MQVGRHLHRDTVDFPGSAVGCREKRSTIPTAIARPLSPVYDLRNLQNRNLVLSIPKMNALGR